MQDSFGLFMRKVNEIFLLPINRWFYFHMPGKVLKPSLFHQQSGFWTHSNHGVWRESRETEEKGKVAFFRVGGMAGDPARAYRYVTFVICRTFSKRLYTRRALYAAKGYTAIKHFSVNLYLLFPFLSPMPDFFFFFFFRTSDSWSQALLGSELWKLIPHQTGPSKNEQHQLLLPCQRKCWEDRRRLDFFIQTHGEEMANGDRNQWLFQFLGLVGDWMMEGCRNVPLSHTRAPFLAHFASLFLGIWCSPTAGASSLLCLQNSQKDCPI